MFKRACGYSDSRLDSVRLKPFMQNKHGTTATCPRVVNGTVLTVRQSI